MAEDFESSIIRRSWFGNVKHHWQARPLSAEAFRSIFKPDHAKQTHQNEVDAAREVAKVCCAVFSAMSTSDRFDLDPNKH